MYKTAIWVALGLTSGGSKLIAQSELLKESSIIDVIHIFFPYISLKLYVIICAYIYFTFYLF